MKNNIQLLVITCVIILSTLFTSSLYAQQNAVKVNLYSFGNRSLGYERAYSSKNTLMMEYQKWNQSTSKNLNDTNAGFQTSKAVANINGYRMEFVARHYKKKAFGGGFLEGGLYFGQHDVKITTTTTTTITNDLLNLFFDLGITPESHTNTVAYNNVSVGGGKIGGGFQKTFGILDFEVSAGANINAINSQSIRPNLAFKGISPYARLAIGIAF